MKEKAKRLNIFRAKIIQTVLRDSKPSGRIMYDVKIPEKNRKYYQQSIDAMNNAGWVKYHGGYGWEATAKGKEKLKAYKKRKKKRKK